MNRRSECGIICGLSLAAGGLSLAVGGLSLAACCWMFVAGGSLLEVRCWMFAAGCLLFVCRSCDCKLSYFRIDVRRPASKQVLQTRR